MRQCRVPNTHYESLGRHHHIQRRSQHGRTLGSVAPLVADGKGEIIVVDSGSTDHTVEIAKSHGAKVFVEEWKGYAAQKNSAIDKATGDWILSLDADEEVDPELIREFTGQTDPAPPSRGSPREWCLTMGGSKRSARRIAGWLPYPSQELFSRTMDSPWWILA